MSIVNKVLLLSNRKVCEISEPEMIPLSENLNPMTSLRPLFVLVSEIQCALDL